MTVTRIDQFEKLNRTDPLCFGPGVHVRNYHDAQRWINSVKSALVRADLVVSSIYCGKDTGTEWHVAIVRDFTVQLSLRVSPMCGACVLFY